jgi:hypothetical protein
VNPLVRINAAWERFFFEPTSTATLAVVRIFFGLMTTLWTLSLIPELNDLFSDDSVLPDQPHFAKGVWGLLGIQGSDAALYGLFALLLVASVCLCAGCYTRIAAAVVFVGVLSFERRNPFVFNSGDVLVRAIAFYLMLAPAGAALSVDRWRQSRERFWEFPLRAPWALRLIQIQLSCLYLSTVWDKVRGTTWNDGTAVSYAFRIEDLARFPVPHFLPDSLLLVNMLTFGTLAIELSIGILIWNRALRPYVIALGVMLHLGIDYRIRVGFFAPAIFTAYLAFVAPERMEQAALWVRGRLERRGLVAELQNAP